MGILSLYDDGEHRNLLLSDHTPEGSYATQSNQHLIIHRKAAMLLDPGGYTLFREVQAEVRELLRGAQIRYLFLSHQDPDVVGSLNPWLMTTRAIACVPRVWLRFVPHVGLRRIAAQRIVGIEDEGATLDLDGAELHLIPAHFLHSAGNMHVYDPIAKILYTGDVGASLGVPYREVPDFEAHLPSMEPFHRRYMASRKAMQAWVRRVRDLDVEIIAPQHGALFRGRSMVQRFLQWCEQLECGVDLL